MQNRPAFKLKNLLIVYNTFQIVANIAVWIYVSEHYMVKLFGVEKEFARFKLFVARVHAVVLLKYRAHSAW